MACRRSGVRIPLAPLFFETAFEEKRLTKSQTLVGRFRRLRGQGSNKHTLSSRAPGASTRRVIQPAETARVAGRILRRWDRWTRPTSSAGSDRLDVRLDAIDGLERIMIDSDRDHPAIVEALAAFVCECAPAASAPDLDTGAQPEPCPPADSQTALTVLARRQADEPNADESTSPACSWPVQASTTRACLVRS